MKFHDFTVVSTSAEVVAVIRAKHHEDLVVFSSYSNPEGGCMETTYGFVQSDAPIFGIRTTWDKGEPEYKRLNEKHEYWLMLQQGATGEGDGQD